MQVYCDAQVNLPGRNKCVYYSYNELICDANSTRSVPLIMIMLSLSRVGWGWGWGWCKGAIVTLYVAVICTTTEREGGGWRLL